jgi:8-oxo-dGTP diphosphatase
MPTLGVFAAILDDDGRILCVRMNYATHAWTTPGGRVEPGESPDDALKREVLEESGLDVVANELVGVYSKPFKDDIVLIFRARVVGRNPWQPNDEISQIGYFGRDDLPEPMGLVARIRIIDVLDGVTGVVRIIPRPGASIYPETTALCQSMAAALRRRSHRQEENETGITGLTARRDRIRGQRTRGSGRTSDDAALAIERHSRGQSRRHTIVFDGACDCWNQWPEGHSHSTCGRAGVRKMIRGLGHAQH